MHYVVKKGYSYVDLPTKRVTQSGHQLDSNIVVDPTQLWKLQPAVIEAQVEKVGMVTKHLGQQEPSKEPKQSDVATY